MFETIEHLFAISEIPCVMVYDIKRSRDLRCCELKNWLFTTKIIFHV